MIVNNQKFGFIQFEPIMESSLNKPQNNPINPDYLVGLVDGVKKSKDFFK